MDFLNGEKYNVLVTGSAGVIGRAACRALQDRGHSVIGFDLRETPGVDQAVVGNLTDCAALDRAMSGVTSVIHLGAIPTAADFVEKLVPNNVIAVHEVFEAAVRAGVRRVVFASSGQVVSGRIQEGVTIRLEDGPAPVNHYALLKLWGEQLGAMMWRNHGVSFIGMRIGFCPRTAEEVKRIEESEICRAMYLSPRDAGRFLVCAVEADSIECEILFATSRCPATPLFDLEPARRLIGYEPVDLFPDGCGTI